MRKCSFIAYCVGLIMLSGSLLFAQEKAAPTGALISGYRQLLAGADKNNDDRLSRAECVAVSKNKKQMAKDCQYWDADGDGFITQEEYVKQVQNNKR